MRQARERRSAPLVTGSLIHIGFPKTGSTALQRTFFPALPGYRYCPSHGPQRSLVLKELFVNLRVAEDGDYLAQAMAGFVSDQRGPQGRPLVLSEEGLVWSTGNARDYHRRTAQRLHALLADGRVLLAVREQRQLLRSFYSEYVQKGGYGRFMPYVANRLRGMDVDPDRFRYDEIVMTYHDVFGPERVKVVAYEQLLSDASAYLEDISAFVGTEGMGDVQVERANPSLSRPGRWIMRQFNYLFRRSIFNNKPRLIALGDPIVFKRALQLHLDPMLFGWAGHGLRPPEQRALDEYGMRYAESNARLQKLTGLDLRRFGYVLPTGS